MKPRAPARSRGAVLIAALLLLSARAAVAGAAGQGPAAVARVAGNPAVRALTPFVGRLVEDGVRRSPTFAAEIRDLSRSNVIVFIKPGMTLPRCLSGRTVFLAARGRFRYLEIVVDTRYNLPRTVGIIGHELRHALEVAAHREIVDQRALAGMYERIGHRNASAPHGRAYDSSEAIAAGRTIMEEMALSPLAAAAADEARSDADGPPAQCDVPTSGSSTMYQLSQSVREPPASVTPKARFIERISHRCFACPATSGTR